MLPVELRFVFGSRINFPMSVELQSSAFMESFVQIYFFYNSGLHVSNVHVEGARESTNIKRVLARIPS